MSLSMNRGRSSSDFAACGQHQTVNMIGRGVVEFDGYNNIAGTTSICRF